MEPSFAKIVPYRGHPSLSFASYQSHLSPCESTKFSISKQVIVGADEGKADDVGAGLIVCAADGNADTEGDSDSVGEGEVGGA